MLQNLFAFSSVKLCFYVRYKFLLDNLMEQEIKINVAIWVAHNFMKRNSRGQNLSNTTLRNWHFIEN